MIWKNCDWLQFQKYKMLKFRVRKTFHLRSNLLNNSIESVVSSNFHTVPTNRIFFVSTETLFSNPLRIIVTINKAMVYWKSWIKCYFSFYIQFVIEFIRRQWKKKNKISRCAVIVCAWALSVCSERSNKNFT